MRALASLTILLLAAGCAPDLAADLGAGRAAVNGEVDTAAEWTGVLGMNIEKPEGFASCTGVLIAPNLLLTARHCVASTQPTIVCGSSPLSDPVPGMNVLATTDTTVSAMSTAVIGLAVEVPPDGNDECGFDIAAVILQAEPFGGAEVYPPRLDRPVATGESFTAVGYGTNGMGGGIGTRRVATTGSVACVGGVDCDIPEAQDTEWVAEDGTFCTSDSGAPALVDGEVVGVISKGLAPCDAPILTSVYAFRDWIREVGRAAAIQGGYPTPEWAAEAAVDAGTGETDAGETPMTESDAGPDGGATGGPEDGGCAASPGRSASPLGLALLALGLLGRPRRSP